MDLKQRGWDNISPGSSILPGLSCVQPEEGASQQKQTLILCFTTTPETFMESCKDEDETNDMVEKGSIV